MGLGRLQDDLLHIDQKGLQLWRDDYGLHVVAVELHIEAQRAVVLWLIPQTWRTANSTLAFVVHALHLLHSLPHPFHYRLSN